MKLNRCSQGLEEVDTNEGDVSSTVSSNKSYTSRLMNLDQRLGYLSL